MSHPDFPKGTKVSFLPGPKATSRVIAEVTGFEGAFLITSDGVGKVRKVRPGVARKI